MRVGEGPDVGDSDARRFGTQAVFEVDLPVGFVGQPQVEVADPGIQLVVEVVVLGPAPVCGDRLDHEVLNEAGQVGDEPELLLAGQRPW